MPGYSADRFPELSADDREDYSCSICQEIFNTPVTTTCCGQTFCEDCITQWLNNNTTCPFDRKPLTRNGLSRAAKVILNTLGRFQIQCDYWSHGCREVVKLSDLAQHTVNCSYKEPKCAKCQCKQTAGHDCIGALLAENSELKKQLAVSRAAQGVNELHINAQLSSQQTLCANGHRELTPGHECIAELRAFKRRALAKINELEHALQLTSQINQPLTTDHQIMADCRRHLSTPELLYNTMDSEMIAKTLAIIRDQFNTNYNLLNVCKHVCDQMDLEYGTSWHCIVSTGARDQHYYTPHRNNLVRVKIGQITLLLYHINTVNVKNLKARLRRNKVERKINTVETKMKSQMVSAVETIALDVIDRSATILDIASNIVDKMDAKYPDYDWQCVVCDKADACHYIIYDRNTYIRFNVEHLDVVLYSAH